MPYLPEHDEVANPLRQGLRAESTPEPCTVVVFGASGDLAHRKLLPALYNLVVSANLPAAFGLVGVSKSEFTDDEFKKDMRAAQKPSHCSWSKCRSHSRCRYIASKVLPRGA